VTLCTVVSLAVTWLQSVIKGERNDVPNLGVIGQGLDNRKESLNHRGEAAGETSEGEQQTLIMEIGRTDEGKN
jgi:hypothetical protein